LRRVGAGALQGEVTQVLTHTTVSMDTVVAVRIVGHGDTDTQRAEREHACERALDWFREIEATCSRFDPSSELRRLCACVGAPVAAGAILFEIVRFALALAVETDGAFDPTVGRRMEARGFDRNY